MDEDHSEFESGISAYRSSLEKLEQQVQSDYGKAVMTLSGGALALSVTFIKDILGTKPMVEQWTLLGAWICWIASIAAVLGGFFFSQRALRKAIAQVDERTIYLHKPGGVSDLITEVLNCASGFCFIAGLGFHIYFVSKNMSL